MPSSVRSRGCFGGGKASPSTPMSERQQMALLMQMTSKSNEPDLRSHGEGPSLRSKNRNERGETGLHLAAIKGDVEQVAKLLAHRADPNACDFAGWTPLHEACNHGWYEVAHRLIQAGADVNAKGLDDDTPLHDAAQNGHLKLIQLLIEKGADIHSKNVKGKTPLDAATPGAAAVMLNPNLSIPEPTTRLQPRLRDEKKAPDSSKQKNSTVEESMDTSKANLSEDVYEFKSAKESGSPESKAADAMDLEGDSADLLNTSAAVTEENGSKRNFSETNDNVEESTTDDDPKRKKRKDDSSKEPKATAPQRNASQNKGQSGKQASGSQGKAGAASSSKASSDKSPSLSPKPATASDAELEDGKSDLKVPPLKIVIPQGSTNEQEMGSNRNGKNSSQRSHQALPYVVPSSNNESNEKDAAASSSPVEATSVKNDEKKENSSGTEDQRSGHHQRVLRSSHRSGTVQGSADRSSNNSSPQLQRSHSPSPSASPSTPSNQPETSTSTIHNNSTAPTSKSSDTQVAANNEAEQAAPAATSNSSSSTPTDLHPRKRKIKPNKEPPAPSPAHESPEAPAVSEIHPHEQPITNCYQLYLNIRKQIEKRRKSLYPVQPKPPEGFEDYLMNRCTYVLAGTAPTTPNITYPATLPSPMKDLFSDQEKERYRLRMQHVIEKEKLVLSVEQEILRVHGRAARALANQLLPFSVCTILRQKEVYNLITPEQEEKDRNANARSRQNGRLFISWLQDVDDKWEKIKEHMLLRHHNEAESLHAVQKMDWEWKLKELNLCDAKTTPSIDELHVPMVHVSDDFDLLPA